MKPDLSPYIHELDHHLCQELLPFWTSRMIDKKYGGYITHFDQNGQDMGTDEKSLIAQTRSVFTLASAHRASYGGGKYLELAKHGVDYLLENMWDKGNGGCFWMTNRAGEVTIDQKIMYGHSFVIYSLSEYTLASGDPVGLEYAEKTFDLIEKHAWDPEYGGYFEMFSKDWNRNGPGSLGGDRKTLDVHMHLMEAFTTLYEASGKQKHKDKLIAVIDLLLNHQLHKKYGTAIPQFWADWSVAPQIKFDIVWGWDRFSEDGQKSSALDNTSYGHNVEFAWLLHHAIQTANLDFGKYEGIMKKLVDHAVENGIDHKYGGVYVEGAHSGAVYDREKEFWQQAEVMIGMLDACLMWGYDRYWEAYVPVHRFVVDHMIHHEVGEWWPLMTREGKPIWTHMSHSWKVNYHTVRAGIQCLERLKRLDAD